MIAPRWRKVLRDLWNNRTRTILVVFSIAIGVAAIGMVASTYMIITDELPASYAAINPASGRIFTSPLIDDSLVVLRNLEEVQDIDGRHNTNVRIQIGPDSWRDLQLIVFDDFDDIQINKIESESGKWPPEEGEILIERASLVLIDAQVGDTVLVETINGQRRRLKIAGLAHDITDPAGTFTNQPIGYTNFETLATFGYVKDYNELLVTVEGDSLDRDHVRRVLNRVESKVEKGGGSIFGTIIPDPGKHWFESYLAPMSAILGVLGVIILLLSGLLVINTISAMLSQQVRQIGMMKAVGAQTYQLFILYEVSMLLIGLLALAIAVPLGQLGTRFIVGIITGIINFDFINFNTPASVLLIQIALSVLVPMIVAMVPILSGSRVTVHEAINDYGITNNQFGESVIDKALGYVRGLPRPLLLSLRNTFRRKMRLTLTLLALTLGSAIFIAVLSVYAGLMATLDEALDYYRFDILVSFSRPYRIEQVEAELSRVPGIVTSETWGVTSTRIINQDGSETDTIILVAPPTDTELINPNVIEGRWLVPDDEGAIVINSDVLAEKPDISVGDEIALNIEGSEKNWQVVGIVRSVMSGPQAYTNYPYFARVTGGYGEAGAVYLATERHDPLYQIEMAKELENYFGRVGINVASTSLVAELRATAVSQFNVIFVFLLMMAVLLTIVGGFGLTGTMSLNVLERTREIGVMRAIGASNGAVMQIVIVEGVLIGLISWILGIILAYPLGWMLSDIVGMGFLRTSISYTYSTTGAIVWLFVVILLAIVASILPARSATSVPVRDVLAYE